MAKELINEPNELKDEEVEIIEEGETEKDELCGAEDSFEESVIRPNEKETEE